MGCFPCMRTAFINYVNLLARLRVPAPRSIRLVTPLERSNLAKAAGTRGEGRKSNSMGDTEVIRSNDPELSTSRTSSPTQN